jgi:uncharacterized membrane protein
MLLAGVARADGPFHPVDFAEARPAIIKMDPGNSTVTQGAKAQRSSKPKVIPVTGSVAGASASSGPAAPANDYDFCNRTSYQLMVAVGLKNAPVVVTRGWWPLNPGECKVFIKGPLTSNIYFSHARTSFIHLGPIRVWGGKHRLCAGKGTFQATSSEGQPCGPGHSHLDFARVDTGGKSGWRTTLTESDQIKTLEQARTAGLQRLLSDVGLFEGAVDGVGGPKLTEAIGRARGALGLSSSDPAQLHARLVAEASQIQQISGLTLCNRSERILYTAYGREINGKKSSSGWYVLQPGVCEKVVKDPLSEPFVYAYATPDQEEADAPVGDNWRGTQLFCVRDGEFDIEDGTNCDGKGLVATGFGQLSTEGRPGVVYEFRGAGAPEPGN